ncbi:hypothetical protein AN948_07320 [Rhodococcus sp. ADH]|nr:hypothetical protein AN948_07320 [Rhodococcus sp. ADH]
MDFLWVDERWFVGAALAVRDVERWGTWAMNETVFEATEMQCPACHGELELELETDLRLGGSVDRTPRGYKCLEDDCGRKFHTNQVP